MSGKESIVPEVQHCPGGEAERNSGFRGDKRLNYSRKIQSVSDLYIEKTTAIKWRGEINYRNIKSQKYRNPAIPFNVYLINIQVVTDRYYRSIFKILLSRSCI